MTGYSSEELREMCPELDHPDDCPCEPCAKRRKEQEDYRREKDADKVFGSDGKLYGRKLPK